MEFINYSYAKSVAGKIVFATSPLKINSSCIINPQKEDYIKAGYKEVALTPTPRKDGFVYNPRFEIIDDTVVRVWDEREITWLDEATELDNDE